MIQGAERCHAECRTAFIVMLSVITLNVIKLCVPLLTVVAPLQH
jgi:hypothetical protein